MRVSILLCLLFVLGIILVSCSKTPQDTGTTMADKGETPSEEAQVTEGGSDSNVIKDTLGNILKLGGKYKCTVSTESAESTIYVDGENSRTVTELSTGESTYVITKKMPDGNICSYTWFSNEQNQALKICVTPQQPAATTPDYAQAPSSDIEVDCTTHLGPVDLQQPAHLNFLDLSQLSGENPTARVIAVVPID